jgi:hypothetical protein
VGRHHARRVLLQRDLLTGRLGARGVSRWRVLSHLVLAVVLFTVATLGVARTTAALGGTLAVLAVALGVVRVAAAALGVVLRDVALVVAATVVAVGAAVAVVAAALTAVTLPLPSPPVAAPPPAWVLAGRACVEAEGASAVAADVAILCVAAEISL